MVNIDVVNKTLKHLNSLMKQHIAHGALHAYDEGIKNNIAELKSVIHIWETLKKRAMVEVENHAEQLIESYHQSKEAVKEAE